MDRPSSVSNPRRPAIRRRSGDTRQPSRLPPRAPRRMAGEHGVTYLMLMFAIVLMGVALTAVGKHWSIAVKRDREAELAFRGNRIKTAIQLYAADYEVMKATRANRYPLTLEQLTQKPKRYLPVVYKDPITGQDFDLIKVGAEIRGVKSRSKHAPLDQVTFKKATAYNQITFQVEAQAAGAACTPTPNPINPLLTVPCMPASPSPRPAAARP